MSNVNYDLQQNCFSYFANVNDKSLSHLSYNAKTYFTCTCPSSPHMSA